jgi:CBS domain-containing protein
VHHLVVMDGERIAGIITDRDLGGAHGVGTRAGKQVADLMAPSVIVVAPEMSVSSAANLMRCNTINCLPVVDGKTLVGIVTTSDILEMVGSNRR